MKLITSNPTKLTEFRNFIDKMGYNLDTWLGPDIREVDGSIDEVIIYKALDTGKGFVVEDTILVVDGEPIIDIKWKIHTLPPDTVGSWITSVGYNDGNYIYVYRGLIAGRIIPPKGTGYGFDPYFIPEGMNKTLAELKSENNLSGWSARELAIMDLIESNPILTIPISIIKEWKGRYQNDGTN